METQQFPRRIKERCHFLMLFLIILLLSYHYVTERPLLILALNTMTLITGVYAVGDSKRHIATAVSIGILNTLLAGTTMIFRPPGLDIPTVLSFDLPVILSLAAFYVFTLIRILGYVLRGREVTKDKIYGAVSVYLLIGLAWASLYGLVFEFQPEAFSTGSAASSPAAKDAPDFIYFSFVTLCTIGFGDITPVSGLARSLAILEGITGVFFIAVLVSRLVTLYRPDLGE